MPNNKPNFDFSELDNLYGDGAEIGDVPVIESPKGNYGGGQNMFDGLDDMVSDEPPIGINPISDGPVKPGEVVEIDLGKIKPMLPSVDPAGPLPIDEAGEAMNRYFRELLIELDLGDSGKLIGEGIEIDGVDGAVLRRAMESLKYYIGREAREIAKEYGVDPSEVIRRGLKGGSNLEKEVIDLSPLFPGQEVKIKTKSSALYTKYLKEYWFSPDPETGLPRGPQLINGEWGEMFPDEQADYLRKLDEYIRARIDIQKKQIQDVLREVVEETKDGLTDQQYRSWRQAATRYAQQKGKSFGTRSYKTRSNKCRPSKYFVPAIAIGAMLIGKDTLAEGIEDAVGEIGWGITDGLTFGIINGGTPLGDSEINFDDPDFMTPDDWQEIDDILKGASMGEIDGAQAAAAVQAWSADKIEDHLVGETSGWNPSSTLITDCRAQVIQYTDDLFAQKGFPFPAEDVDRYRTMQGMINGMMWEIQDPVKPVDPNDGASWLQDVESIKDFIEAPISEDLVRVECGDENPDGSTPTPSVPTPTPTTDGSTPTPGI